MDEFDALVSSAGNTDQERRVSACLKSLFDDQLNSKNDDHNKTIVIAVTSRPEFIDTSFRRSGRLEIEIELGVPDFKQRTEIIKAILERSGGLVTRINDNDIEFLSRNAHGYVGADLEAVLAQVCYYSMAIVNLNKSKKLVTNTTAASKNIPKRSRICII